MLHRQVKAFNHFTPFVGNNLLMEITNDV